MGSISGKVWNLNKKKTTFIKIPLTWIPCAGLAYYFDHFSILSCTCHVYNHHDWLLNIEGNNIAPRNFVQKVKL